jgi:glycosyltransferase involved in cell wall biosynthesis
MNPPLARDTEILTISSSCLEVPPVDYGGLEQVVYENCIGISSESYNITCAAPKGSEIDNVEIIETVESTPPPDCLHKEKDAFRYYSDYLPSYDVVIDHSWKKYSYLMKQNKPELMQDTTIIGVWHGEPSTQGNPPVDYPNWLSVSRNAADAWTRKTDVKTKHVYNSVDFSEYRLRDDHWSEGDFLLTLNRISPEKGIKQCIDVADDLEFDLIIAGEDQYLSPEGYVQEVMDLCSQSDYAQYYGRVSHEKKKKLLQDARATVLLPQENYKEVFGLY